MRTISIFWFFSLSFCMYRGSRDDVTVIGHPTQDIETTSIPSSRASSSGFNRNTYAASGMSAPTRRQSALWRVKFPSVPKFFGSKKEKGESSAENLLKANMGPRPSVTPSALGSSIGRREFQSSMSSGHLTSRSYDSAPGRRSVQPRLRSSVPRIKGFGPNVTDLLIGVDPENYEIDEHGISRYKGIIIAQNADEDLVGEVKNTNEGKAILKISKRNVELVATIRTYDGNEAEFLFFGGSWYNRRLGVTLEFLYDNVVAIKERRRNSVEGDQCASEEVFLSKAWVEKKVEAVPPIDITMCVGTQATAPVSLQTRTIGIQAEEREREVATQTEPGVATASEKGKEVAVQTELIKGKEVATQTESTKAGALNKRASLSRRSIQQTEEYYESNFTSESESELIELIDNKICDELKKCGEEYSNIGNKRIKYAGMEFDNKNEEFVSKELHSPHYGSHWRLVITLRNGELIASLKVISPGEGGDMLCLLNSRRLKREILVSDFYLRNCSNNLGNKITLSTEGVKLLNTYGDDLSDFSFQKPETEILRPSSLDGCKEKLGGGAIYNGALELHPLYPMLKGIMKAEKMCVSIVGNFILYEKNAISGDYYTMKMLLGDECIKYGDDWFMVIKPGKKRNQIQLEFVNTTHKKAAKALRRAMGNVGLKFLYDYDRMVFRKEYAPSYNAILGFEGAVHISNEGEGNNRVFCVAVPRSTDQDKLDSKEIDFRDEKVQRMRQGRSELNGILGELGGLVKILDGLVEEDSV